jgi:hypothetical protein
VGNQIPYIHSGVVPFDHPTDRETMSKAMNAGPTSAWALANPSTVSEPRERVPTCPIAEVTTLLRHEESIRQCIITQTLPLGSVLSDLLSAGGVQRNQTRLAELGLDNLYVRVAATEPDLFHLQTKGFANAQAGAGEQTDQCHVGVRPQ